MGALSKRDCWKRRGGEFCDNSTTLPKTLIVHYYFQCLNCTKNISGLRHFLYYYLLDEMIKVFCMMCVLFLFWFFFRIVKRSRRMNVENLLLFTFAWDNILSRKHIFFFVKIPTHTWWKFYQCGSFKNLKKNKPKIVLLLELFHTWSACLRRKSMLCTLQLLMREMVKFNFTKNFCLCPPTHSPALAALLYIYHKMHACWWRKRTLAM